jgi:hypothetical protein
MFTTSPSIRVIQMIYTERSVTTEQSPIELTFPHTYSRLFLYVPQRVLSFEAQHKYLTSGKKKDGPLDSYFQSDTLRPRRLNYDKSLAAPFASRLTMGYRFVIKVHSVGTSRNLSVNTSSMYK